MVRDVLSPSLTSHIATRRVEHLSGGVADSGGSPREGSNTLVQYRRETETRRAQALHQGEALTRLA